jgi:SLT domain-containing protein
MATLGIGALMPGLAGAGMGLGLLGGTGALAFGDISKTLSAAHQASQNVGITPQQTAATNYSNSVQVVQAQQSVTQAREQAAQDAVTSANSIQQADMNLASVARNTAASQVQALQSVQQAQQGVETATYSLSEANYNLSQAYVQAREQITQLNNQLADSKLSVQSASLAVQQAEYQEKLVNQDAYSTSIQRQQASLAVAQAKQQVTDATDQESNAQVAANLANKQGISGSQTVIQAKQGVTAAQYSQVNAANSYADAQRNLTNTELNNAAQVKQAQMQAAQAQEQAAYQQKMDAQSVASAERNLTSTIKEQQLQWAATQSTANQAANQFAKYMANLSPAGRSFVNQILGMRGAFKGLEADAQTAVLPGVTIFLKGVASLAPQVKKGVTEMGGAISKAFAGFGKELQTPAAAKVFDGLVKNGMQFLNVVLPAFGQFFGELAKIGSLPGASSGLAGLLSGIARGLTGMAAAVGKYEPQINGFLKAVGNIIAQMGPSLGNMIGLAAKVLGPLTSYLNKHPDGTVAKVLGGIAGGLLAFKVLKGPISTVLSLPGKIGETWGKITKIPEKVSGTWGKLVSFPGKVSGAWGKVFGEGGSVPGMVGGLKNMLTGLPGKMSAIAGAIKEWGIWSKIASGATKVWTGIQLLFDAAMDANPIGLVVIAIAGLVVGVIEAYKHFTWFRDGVKDAFHGIEVAALWLWHNVFDPMWQGIKTGAEWVYDHAIKPLWNDWIKPVFDDIKSGVDLVTHHWSTVWAAMTAGFKAPVNFLIGTVYDHGIARLWNDVVGAVGLGSIKLPIIPQLAGGGVLPGYAPGHDTVPALLSPGESVLTPGATRAVGAPAINALNAAYAPSGGGHASGHFAQGGTVGSQGGGQEQEQSGSGGGEAGKLAGKETEKRTVERPAEHVLTLGKFANGGVVQRFSLGGIVSGLLSGAGDTAKAIAALATGNTTAFTNALAPLIGTSASGSLGRVMVALPKTLVTDAAKAAMGMMGGGSSSSGGGSLTAAVKAWFDKAVAITGVGMSWVPDLETIGEHESSLNPAAINLSDSNAAAGDPSKGILQLIATTFEAYHQPGTSPNIFEPVANIAAGINYIRGRYGNPGHVPGIMSLNTGGPYVGYDSGGVLPPGMTAAVNMTGKPEAVLTSEQTQALESLVSRPSGPSGQAPTVINNWYGPQMPSQEQLAEMDRHYSLLVG